ncbi:hypothetical protein M2310_001459 [Rhizobium leguminosarum]|jgi:hypothetical protein|uniref:Uncharacterized protein n=1 Tax=Rhizobium esperanzae TaxID=1967781 RepID=A0A7W6XTS1_9HYPH|nr:hypothetical protein [Rhizobium esperanzae]MDH6200788.1 hypothetical protein [Rhizobium leguminosarum]
MEIAPSSPSPGDTGKAQRAKSTVPLVGPGCFCYFHLGAYWLGSHVGSMSANQAKMRENYTTDVALGPLQAAE